MSALAANDQPQRKVELTLARIRHAAKEEFCEKGGDATTMDNIADRAKLSKQLLYHYFGNKKELYNQVLAEIIEESHRPVLATDYDALDAETAIRTFFSNMFDTSTHRNNNFMLSQMLHEGDNLDPNGIATKLGARMVAILSAVLERGKRDGIVHPQVCPQDIYMLACLVTSGFLTSRGLMSRYMAFDFSSDDAFVTWRRFAIETVMLALRQPGRVAGD